MSSPLTRDNVCIRVTNLVWKKKKPLLLLAPPPMNLLMVSDAAPGNSRAMTLKAVFSYLQSRAKRENLISNGSLG